MATVFSAHQHHEGFPQCYQLSNIPGQLYSLKTANTSAGTLSSACHDVRPLTVEMFDQEGIHLFVHAVEGYAVIPRDTIEQVEPESPLPFGAESLFVAQAA